MTRICFWYHDPDSNDLNPELRDKILGLGFMIEKPKNKTEFLNTINQLSGQNIVIHIFAHGNKTHVAPYNMRDVRRKDLEGQDVNIIQDLVSYSEIQFKLTALINNGHHLTINMMSVCNSYYSPIKAHHFVSCQGESQVMDESLVIYSHETENWDSTIWDLNSKNINPKGKFHLSSL